MRLLRHEIACLYHTVRDVDSGRLRHPEQGGMPLGGKWRELGVKDGINGEQAIQIEKHRKACAENCKGISVNFD